MLISKFDSAAAEDEIMTIEQQYAMALPLPYKMFLMRYNGGYTPKTRFRLKGISSDVRGFYGTGRVGLPLDPELIAAWIPKHMFPIGCDSFGNLLLICVEGDLCGAIFFHDHEKGQKLSVLSSDFPSFVRACKSEPIPEAARRSIAERKEALLARGRGDVITPALVQMWQDELDKYGNMVQEELVL